MKDRPKAGIRRKVMIVSSPDFDLQLRPLAVAWPSERLRSGACEVGGLAIDGQVYTLVVRRRNRVDRVSEMWVRRSVLENGMRELRRSLQELLRAPSQLSPAAVQWDIAISLAL